MSVSIPLTQGMVALIDEQDLPLIVGIKWRVLRTAQGCLYAAHAFARAGRSAGQIYMHRLILAAPSHLFVDHIDRNGLNNCRANLRLCDESQNQCNRAVPKSNVTGFKGVVRRGAGFKGSVRFRGVNYQKVGFLTAEEADAWCRAKRDEVHGQFANHS